MRVEEEFQIACPTEETYRSLNDVGGIGHCIAGVQDVQVRGADDSQWLVEVRAGFMARKVKLDAKIVDRRPPEYIAFIGSGHDVDINGNVQLTALDAHRTSCRILIEAVISGPLGPMVELMARGPQQRLIEQTIANLREKLEASSGDLSTPSPAPAPVRRRRTGGLVAGLRIWWHSRR